MSPSRSRPKRFALGLLFTALGLTAGACPTEHDPSIEDWDGPPPGLSSTTSESQGP